MITKRIIPCLDVKNGRVVKGVNFEGLQDMADPVEMARYYNASGADELVFYDITASSEGRSLDSVKLLWSFLLTARSTQYDSVVFSESINQYLGPAGSVKHRRLAIKYAPVKCSLKHVFYICCITILFSGGFEIFCFYLSSIYV